MENIVSVVVCTYNQEDTIARALDSILMQKCHIPFEIIIGEDHSTDNTLAVCQTYAQKHPDTIRLIANQQNKGLIDNYFDCLLSARGCYIADCAGDDFWVDSLKLEKQVCIMEAHPDVTMVLTRWNSFNEHTKQVTPGPPPPFTTDMVRGEDILEAIVTQTDMSVFHLCTSLYRADAFRKAYHEDTFLFRNKDFGTEDTQIAFMMARQGNIAYLPDVTLHYSVGKSSVSELHDHEKQFHFVRKITGLGYYLTEKYCLHSKALDKYFSLRILALAMHAFRAHSFQLFQQTMQCESEWHVRRMGKTALAYTIMSHPCLWSLALRLRNFYVAIK